MRLYVKEMDGRHVGRKAAAMKGAKSDARPGSQAVSVLLLKVRLVYLWGLSPDPDTISTAAVLALVMRNVEFRSPVKYTVATKAGCKITGASAAVCTKCSWHRHIFLTS